MVCFVSAKHACNQWNFHKAKWSHYTALTNKFEKTLLLLDSLDMDVVYQNFCNVIKKAIKTTFSSSHQKTIFCDGMQSVNLFTYHSCSLLRETTQLWLLKLYLPNLTKSRGINGPKQFGALTFHSNHKAWSILNKFYS